MKALVIGCGRVGSNLALQLTREGWDVTAVDEKEEALGRLGDNWAGGFVLGHGMDTDVLRDLLRPRALHRILAVPQLRPRLPCRPPRAGRPGCRRHLPEPDPGSARQAGGVGAARSGIFRRAILVLREWR